MFGEWLDVVSLLELSVCHYIWTSFMSIFFIYVDFESNHSQDGLENYERWCSFTCFTHAADFYATKIIICSLMFCMFPCLPTEFYYWYICINIDTCIDQKTYM